MEDFGLDSVDKNGTRSEKTSSSHHLKHLGSNLRGRILNETSNIFPNPFWRSIRKRRESLHTDFEVRGSHGGTDGSSGLRSLEFPKTMKDHLGMIW
jgi:hypothetical protein